MNPTTAKLTRANIYAGGEFLAEDAPDAAETGTPVATQLRVTDQVGSLRGRWDYAGKQNGGCTSFPYGDGFSCTNPPVSTAEFTGKDRDNESALDYFGARYYSNRMGRFTNPDWSSGPIPLAYADFKNPQSLNLYGHVLNSPLSNVDRDGHDWSKVWTDIKKAVSETNVKVSLGVGVGAKGKVGPVEAKIEAALKGNMSVGGDGSLTASKLAEIGATVGKDGQEYGRSASIEQGIGSANLKTGEVGGVEAPTTETVSNFGAGGSTAEGSAEGASLGAEEADGLAFGVSGHITQEGIGALGDALSEAKQSLFPFLPLPPQTRPNPPTE